MFGSVHWFHIFNFLKLSQCQCQHDPITSRFLLSSTVTEHWCVCGCVSLSFHPPSVHSLLSLCVCLSVCLTLSVSGSFEIHQRSCAHLISASKDPKEESAVLQWWWRDGLLPCPVPQETAQGHTHTLRKWTSCNDDDSDDMHGNSSFSTFVLWRAGRVLVNFLSALKLNYQVKPQNVGSSCSLHFQGMGCMNINLFVTDTVTASITVAAWGGHRETHEICMVWCKWEWCFFLFSIQSWRNFGVYDRGYQLPYLTSWYQNCVGLHDNCQFVGRNGNRDKDRQIFCCATSPSTDRIPMIGFCRCTAFFSGHQIKRDNFTNPPFLHPHHVYCIVSLDLMFIGTLLVITAFVVARWWKLHGCCDYSRSPSEMG